MDSSLSVSVPTKGSSSILLTSNGLVTLTNVLAEESFIFPNGPPSGYKTALKTEAGVWDIVERGGFWSVQIDLKNNQEIHLRILRRGDNEFELSYRPDPDREAFIYIRDSKENTK